MLTTATITDAQIRELHDAAVARFERGVDTAEDREAVQLFKMAMSMLSAEDHAEVTKARARCAEILNARAARPVARAEPR